MMAIPRVRFPLFQSKRGWFALALLAALVIVFAITVRATALQAVVSLALSGCVAAGVFFGTWPALFAIALSAILYDFLFIPPLYSVSFDTRTAMAAVCFGIVGLSARTARAWALRTGRDQKLGLLLFDWVRSYRGATPDGTSATQELGRLDGYDNGQLYGWALDPANKTLPSKLTLYIDGRPVAETLAVHYRPDIGPHAFYLDLSCLAAPDTEIRADLRFLDGRLLPNAPLIVRTPPSSPPQRKEAVLFMHISKTAGTAFREALAQNYRPCEIAWLYPDAPGILCSHKLGMLPLEQRRTFRLIAGHFQYGIHNFFPQDCVYVTVVRNPVERIISEHRYLREKAAHASGDESKESPADSLIRMLDAHANVNLDNLLVRCFSGVHESELPAGAVDEKVFTAALENLRNRFFFVGHQESLETAYETLRERFDWKPVNLKSVNISRVGSPVEYERARAAIEHSNRWDLKLYAEILKLFPI